MKVPANMAIKDACVFMLMSLGLGVCLALLLAPPMTVVLLLVKVIL